VDVMADTGVLIVFRCEFQWGGGFVARLNSLLKNAFAGREVAQGIKPNSDEMYGLDGHDESHVLLQSQARNFSAGCKSRALFENFSHLLPGPWFYLDVLSLESLYIDVMSKPDLLPGTLDMLILKTLARAPLHGYGIAQSIRRMSEDVLTVEEGSLYPALQRLLLQGWVKAEWKMTETNRRARFYTLTAEGRKQLGVEVSEFQQMIAAIGRVLAEQS
jgi:PadR family transcriptional regulator, regulatory protein PadR